MPHTGDAAGAGRPPTLQDVADAAGVAVSTASRALSNPGRVSARTREHVHEVARRLNYRPNLMARALPAGRSTLLAMVIPDITNPHHFGLIRGAEARARAAGYTVVLVDAQGSAALETDHLDRLGPAIDGVLLVSPRMPEPDLLALRGRRPVVLFNREAAGFPSVTTDSDDAGRQIVEHLAALGHRSLAYLAGPADAWPDGQRWHALSRHAAAAGVAITRRGPFVPTVEHGAAAADVGLATGASALVAYNDLLAIGVLRRLERRGVAVPGRISVVGFDDIFGSDFCHPPLTTVTSPAEEAGRVLTDLLLDPRPGTHRVVLPTPLRVRDSTGPAPGSSGAADR